MTTIRKKIIFSYYNKALENLVLNTGIFLFISSRIETSQRIIFKENINDNISAIRADPHKKGITISNNIEI